MVTRALIDGADYSPVTDALSSWTTAAAGMVTIAESYERGVHSPGGQPWSGNTAENVVAIAGHDRATVTGLSEDIQALVSNVDRWRAITQGALQAVRDLITAAEAEGFTVGDDLSVTFTDTTPPDVAKQDRAEDLAFLLATYAQLWWTDEQALAALISAADTALTLVFTPMDTHTPIAPPPGATLPVSSAAGDRTWQDMLIPPQIRRAANVAPAVTNPASNGGTGTVTGGIGATLSNTDTGAAGLPHAGLAPTIGGIPVPPAVAAANPLLVDKPATPATAAGPTTLRAQLDAARASVGLPALPATAAGLTAEINQTKAALRAQMIASGTPAQHADAFLATLPDPTPGHTTLDTPYTSAVPTTGTPQPAPGFVEAIQAGFDGLNATGELMHDLMGTGTDLPDRPRPGVAESWGDVAAQIPGVLKDLNEHIADPIGSTIRDINEAPSLAYYLGEKTFDATATAVTLPFGAEAALGRHLADDLLSGTHHTPDALDYDLPIGPMLPQSVDDIRKWLPEVNHGQGMDVFDPARAVNCGQCALAVDQRLTGALPDASAGLGTLSIPEMEAATGLRQVPATPSQIEQHLIDQGPGAHTVIGVDRGNGFAGHWFNAYYDGAKVYAVDGQTGQVVGWPPDMDVPGGPVTNWDMGVPK